MIQVQSIWLPLIDRKPQVFMRIPDAKADDFKPAVPRVYRPGDTNSGIGVQVLPAP
jgi:hypothetical protein